MLRCLAIAVTGVSSLNERPIIGILTEPLGSLSAYNQTYIASSYVKFAESGGARVVPLHFDAPIAELKELFSQINGIIFPGGGADVKKSPHGNRFREAAQLLFSWAIVANSKGDAFPIHGTCLGFHLLHSFAADDESVICERCFETEGTPMPLNFTDEAVSSKLFSELPLSLRKALATQNLTENSHASGVTPEAYQTNAKLREFFTVLSTNQDRRGREFISTVEAKLFPISATQWHPEKNNFEWGKIGQLGYAAIPHSVDAVLVSQYFANNFVSRARMSEHRFTSEEEENRALIYNFGTVPDPHGYYSEIYVFQRHVQASAEHMEVLV